MAPKKIDEKDTPSSPAGYASEIDNQELTEEVMAQMVHLDDFLTNVATSSTVSLRQYLEYVEKMSEDYGKKAKSLKSILKTRTKAEKKAINDAAAKAKALVKKEQTRIERERIIDINVVLPSEERFLIRLKASDRFGTLRKEIIRNADLHYKAKFLYLIDGQTLGVSSWKTLRIGGIQNGTTIHVQYLEGAPEDFDDDNTSVPDEFYLGGSFYGEEESDESYEGDEGETEPADDK
eukprot:symbB.v1.2.017197.t1/scaffold1335.1/size146336/8